MNTIFKKRLWLLLGALTLLLAAGLLSGCSAIQDLGGDSGAQAQEPTSIPVVQEGPTLTTEGRLVPAQDAWLSFQQSGPLAEVLVAEGEEISAGQVLARLGDRARLEAALTAAELEQLSARQALDDLQQTAPLASSQARAALAAAERQVIEAQQALDDLDTPDFQQDLDDAWETVQEEKDELEDAQEEFDRYQELSEDNPTRQRAEDDLDEAQKQYDDAVRTYERLQNDLEQARASLAEAEATRDEARRASEDRQDGPSPADLALAQARVDNAAAQVAAAEAALANSEITAPFSGMVTRVNATAGETITAYQPVLQLADLSAWYVETTDLSEIDVVEIYTERPAVVIPDALPDLELEGEIEQIAAGYTERAGDVLYTVRIRLQESDPDLRWGMTTSVEFQRR
jgi:multidrug resistance efflux pump